MEYGITVIEASNGYVLQVPFDWFKSHKPFIVKTPAAVANAVTVLLSARASGNAAIPTVPVDLPA